MYISKNVLKYSKLFTNFLFIIIPFLPIWQWNFYFDPNKPNATGYGGYVLLPNMTNAINYVGFTFVWIFFIIVGGLAGFILTLIYNEELSDERKEFYVKLQSISLYLILFGLLFGVLMAHGVLGIKNMFIAPALYIVLLGTGFLYLTLIDEKKWEKIRREVLAYVFIAPTFIIMIFIFYIPIFIALYLSFQNFYFNPASRYSFLTLETINIGIQNYAIILFPDVPNLQAAGRPFNPQLDLIMLVLLMALCLITIMYGTYGNWSIKKKVITGAIALYSVALLVTGWNALIYNSYDLFLILGLFALASLWVYLSIRTAQSVSDKYKQYMMYLLALIPIIVLYTIGGIFTTGYETVSVLNPYNRTYLDPRPLQVVYNTIVWTFGCVIPQILFGLLLAVVLNKKFHGRTIVRSIMIVPWAVPAFISITVISAFVFQTDTGAFDLIFSWFHFQPYAWMSNQNFLLSAIFVNIYLGYSFTMVAFLAALQTVNPELYEAAEIDGANAWEKFRNITLPNIKPVLIVTSILGFMWTFNMFNVIYLLYRPRTSVVRPENAYILVVYVFFAFYNTPNNWSISASLSFILFIILAVMTWLYTKIAGKGPYDID